jgi:hypothetical protein
MIERGDSRAVQTKKDPDSTGPFEIKLVIKLVLLVVAQEVGLSSLHFSSLGVLMKLLHGNILRS